MKDQLNRPVSITGTPKRIVSLVPSQTELLVDLGLEDTIVGITKFCIHPAYLRKEKTIVGGTKQVHFDRIEALQPDIILCNKEENTQDMIPTLEKIAPVHISDIYTVEDALELIRHYGILFSKTKNAERLIDAIANKKQEFIRFMKDKPMQSAAYFIWKQPWMVAANSNFIDELLRLNHFRNYYQDLERYPQVILHKAQPERADMVLLSTEPYPFNESHCDEVRVYFPKATIRVVDGEMFSWYGSRLLKAFDYFKTLH